MSSGQHHQHRRTVPNPAPSSRMGPAPPSQPTPVMAPTMGPMYSLTNPRIPHSYLKPTDQQTMSYYDMAASSASGSRPPSATPSRTQSAAGSHPTQSSSSYGARHIARPYPLPDPATGSFSQSGGRRQGPNEEESDTGRYDPATFTRDGVPVSEDDEEMLLKEAENIFLFAIIGQGHITLRTEENFVQSRLERALAGAISGAAGKHDCVAETNSRSYNSSLARLERSLLFQRTRLAQIASLVVPRAYGLLDVSALTTTTNITQEAARTWRVSALTLVAEQVPRFEQDTRELFSGTVTIPRDFSPRLMAFSSAKDPVTHFLLPFGHPAVKEVFLEFLLGTPEGLGHTSAKHLAGSLHKVLGIILTAILGVLELYKGRKERPVSSFLETDSSVRHLSNFHSIIEAASHHPEEGPRLRTMLESWWKQGMKEYDIVDMADSNRVQGTFDLLEVSRPDSADEFVLGALADAAALASAAATLYHPSSHHGPSTYYDPFTRSP